MHFEGAPMYKKDKKHQFSLSDFNQPIGLKMNLKTVGSKNRL